MIYYKYYFIDKYNNKQKLEVVQGRVMAHIAAMGVSQISSSIYMPELPFKSQNPQPSSLFLKRISVAHKRFNLVKATDDGSPAPTPGLYSAKQFELTPENVDMVLEDVRPYLISDGGNVQVVSVEDGVVSLQLQGACESCPSATTTMKMGIERVLKEKFGEAIQDIRQIYDEQVVETTAEAVNAHLNILRPAIKNFGGSVEVLSVEEGNCNVKYVGPESIGSGVKAAIKEKFPDIVNVVFTD